MTMNVTTGIKKQTILYPILICLLSSTFFAYEFFLQVSPGVITQDLMRDLGLDAAGLGVLSAFYYYAYAPMQMFAGLLYDRFGPRILLTFATFACALGAILFSVATTLPLASVGRFCMGFGSAFAFTGTLILMVRWMPPHYFSILAGMLQFMGSMGALFGTQPLAEAVKEYGWRSTIFTIGISGFVLAALIYFIVRNGPSAKSDGDDNSSHNELSRLKEVLGNAQSWLLGIFAFTSWAPVLVFASLWGTPFLVAHYHISTPQAASAIAMIWWGIAIGSPLAGWYSEKLKSRCRPLTQCALLSCLTISAVIYIPNMAFWLIYPLLFLFGLAAGSQTLSFAVVKDKQSPQTLGTAMGFNNMMVVAGGAILQPIAGVIMQFVWNGNMQNGIPVYSMHDYQLALFIVPFISLLGAIICKFFIKETNCQPSYPI